MTGILYYSIYSIFRFYKALATSTSPLLLLHLEQPLPERCDDGVCSKSPCLGQVIITFVELLTYLTLE